MSFNPFEPVDHAQAPVGLGELQETPAQWRSRLESALTPTPRPGLEMLVQQAPAAPPQAPGVHAIPSAAMPFQSPESLLPDYDPHAAFAAARAELEEERRQLHGRTAGDFEAGLKTGWEQTKGLGALAASVVGQKASELTGGAIGDGLQKWGYQAYQDTQEAAAPYQEGRVTKIEDIHDPKDVGRWFVSTLGQLVPSIGESALAGLIGAGIGSSATPAGSILGAVGGATSKGAIKTALRKIAEKGMARGLSREAAEKMAGGAAGAALGTFVAGYQMGAGELYGETLDPETGKGNSTAALLGAIPYAGVEALTDMTLAGNIIAGGQGANLVKRVVAGLTEGALLEGGQEVAQEGLSILAGLDSGKEYATEEVISRLGNAFAAGAVGGGVLGGVGGIRQDPNAGKSQVDLLVDRALSDGQLPPGFTDPNALRQAVHDPSLDDVTRAQALSAIGAKLEAKDPILGRLWREAAIDSVAEKRPVSDVLSEIQARLARQPSPANQAAPSQPAPGTPLDAQPPQPIQDIPTEPTPLSDAARQGGAARGMGAETVVSNLEQGGRQSAPPAQPPGSIVPVGTDAAAGADIPTPNQPSGLESLAAQSDAGLTDPGAQDPYRLPIPQPRGQDETLTEQPPAEAQHGIATPDAAGAAGRGLGAQDGVSAADDARPAGFEPTHVTIDGVPVRETSEPGIYVDVEGIEHEDPSAEPLAPVQAPPPASAAVSPMPVGQNAGAGAPAQPGMEGQADAAAADADKQAGTGLTTIEVPVAELKLSQDVPQFKHGANAHGVIRPLQGSYERMGTAPIQVWERLDGSLEIISGRHRFDLAKRTGEKTIPAQIHREADGMTADRAAMIDAELNIRDEQGEIADYVNYFKGSGIDETEAKSRGLLARAKGQRAYYIANFGDETLIAALRGNVISGEAAYQIAQAAPKDARLQTLGIKAVQDGESITHATNLMRAVQAMGARESGSDQTDMFGFDDSALNEAKQMAQIASRKQRELRGLLSPQKAVSKAGEKAASEGITDTLNEQQRKARIQALEAKKLAWENWQTNPELIAEIRQEIQGESKSGDAPVIAPEGAATGAQAPTFQVDQRVQWRGKERIVSKINDDGTIRLRSNGRPINVPAKDLADAQSQSPTPQETPNGLQEEQGREEGAEVAFDVRAHWGGAAGLSSFGQAEAVKRAGLNPSVAKKAPQYLTEAEVEALRPHVEQLMAESDEKTAEDFALAGESPADLDAKRKADEQRAAEEAAQLEEEERKRQADSARDDFNLSVVETNPEAQKATDRGQTGMDFGAGPAADTKPAAQSPADYGSNNKVFTKDAADKARELLRRKLSGGTLNAGIDPEILQAGLTLAGYHIEAGARQFGDYAKAMIADLGESARPYLRSWYESVRYYPGFEAAKGMTPVADMDAAVQASEQAESEPQATEQPAPTEATDPISTLTQDLLSGAEFKSITEARARLAELTGSPIKAGTPEAKRADEMIEQAAVRAAREIVRQTRNEQAAFDALVDLQARMPSLNVRTSTSVMEQAYSTPLPLAYLASRLAGVAQGKRVLEPTAGNGALLIETDPKRATVNELNSDRRKALQAQGFTVSQEDASKRTAFKGTFDVVIANPPFGVVREDNGQSRVFDLSDMQSKYQTTEIDHAISLRALERLEEDGRAVLIIGGPAKTLTDAGRSDAYNGKAKRAFFFTLYNQFRVVDHFTVSGDLYAKQGAAWPVDVIIIDGRGKSERALPAADVPRLVNTLEDLKNELPGTRQENRPDRASADRPAQTGTQSARDDAVSGRPTQSGGRGAGVEPRQPGSVRDGSGRSTESQRSGQLDTADATPEGAGERRGTGVQPAPLNTFQAAYTPASTANSVGTLVPTNMQTAIRGALQRIQDRHSSTDAFVVDRLGYAVSDIPRYFSAEQVDALALALDNMESGKGFIIGDQTGVGKGRVVAGIIRYAIQTGRTPIFVTEKSNLYGDMMRDLQDIGMPEIRPLVTNGQFSLPVDDAARAWTEEAEAARENNAPVPKKRGTFINTPRSAKHNATLTKLANEGRLDQHDVIFTTYSQMQTVAGNRTARHAFIESLADGGIVILDESHNAGGQDTQSRGGDGPGKEGRAGFVRSIIGRAHGVFYSSATYAKRPEVMDLYFKTDLGLAGDVGALRDALEAGGVPLQQVVAAMLAESGQYIRREKSFDGIAYDSPSVSVDRQFAEHSAEIMRGVMEFDKLKKKAVADMDKEIKAEAKSLSVDSSTGGAGAHSTNFTSVMHNNIAQMLLMLKVQPAIDRALSALKAGEKPVIALSNTMGSAIEEYVTDTGLKPGDAINLTYGDLLKRYLQKSRRVTIGNPFGEKETRELTDEELGPKAMAQYRRVLRRIDEIGFSDMPISPIDAIHQALRAEGYKTGEITGRSVTIDYSGKRPVFRRRSSKETSAAGKLKTINAFNSGDLDVIILNQSGSTGLSLHASEKFKDQRPRVMILAQPELNIDTHMQMLGRINRTGQVVLPRYEQLVADIPAEKRPAAILAKKMAMLNASTTAAKDSAVKSKDTPDFMNQYGDQVAATFMSENPEIHAMLDEPLAMSNDGDGLSPDDAIRKVSGRIPLLPLAEQERVYAAIEEAYAELIDMLDRTGQNALEAKTLDLGAKTVKTTPILPTPNGATSAFQQGVDAHEMDVKRLGKPLTLDQIKGEIRKALGVKDDAQVAAEVRQQQQSLLDLGEQYYYGTTRDLSDNVDLDSAKDAKRAQAEMARLSGQYDLFRQAVDYLRVGTAVELIDPQGTPYMGVVGKVEHKGAAAKNQLAPGILKFTFYVADAAQHVRLPLSQVHLSESYGWTDTRDIKGRWSVRPATQEDVEKAFAEGVSESREKRTILTGNMVKGFGFARSGRIINFTDDAGSVRQGILMPKNFDLEKAQSNKPLVFEAPRAMTDFARSIDIAPRAAPLTLASKDGDIKLFKHSASLYALQTESSKKKGGRFFMDRPLIAAAGRDFIKAGSSMRNEFSADRLEDVLGRLYQMGVRLQAQTHKDEARAWLDANKTDDSPRFNLTPSRPAGDRLTREFLQARLDAVTRGWSGLKQMPLKVVNSERALPEAVRTKLKAMRANGTQAIPRAVFVPGDGLYFVAPHIGSVKEAMLALAEEAIGHHGLRAVMGPQFNALLDRVIDERRAGVETMAEAYGLDMNNIEQAREAAEEYLAHAARLDTQETWFQSIVQAIRAMLRKMGVRLKLSDGDIRELLAASNKYVQQGDVRAALKARERFGGTTTERNQDARFSTTTDGLRQDSSGQVQRGGVSGVSGVPEEGGYFDKGPDIPHEKVYKNQAYDNERYLMPSINLRTGAKIEFIYNTARKTPLPPEHAKVLREAARILVSTLRLERKGVTIKFESNLSSEGRAAANTVYIKLKILNQWKKEKVGDKASLTEIIEVLAHEFVHVWQMERGALGDGDSWNGQRRDKNGKLYSMYPYLDRPWEEEAFRLQGVLAKSVIDDLIGQGLLDESLSPESVKPKYAHVIAKQEQEQEKQTGLDPVKERAASNDGTKPLFPIKESQSNQDYRKNMGMDVLMTVDAQRLKQVFEQERGEDLMHKPFRRDKLRELLDQGTAIDAYPIVGAQYSFNIDDGRHRVFVAAERGMQITIATNKESAQKIRELLDAANPDIRFSLGGQTDFAEENRRIRGEEPTLWERAKKELKRQLAPGGLLPKEVFGLKIDRDSHFEAEEMDIRNLLAHFEDAVKAAYGKRFDSLEQTQKDSLGEALRFANDALMDQSIPEPVRREVLKMRQYIDRQSREYATILFQEAQDLLARGQVEQAAQRAGLLETIANNIGEYVHRSYRAFDDPKWVKAVPDAVLNDARDYLTARYEAKAAKLDDLANKAEQRGETDKADAHREKAAKYRDAQRIDKEIRLILTEGTAFDSMESFIKEAKLGAMDMSVLKRRKEIAPEIRALLGEYTDPRLNFAKSATKMSRLIWNNRFLKRVLDAGEGVFLFRDKKDAPMDVTKQIATSKNYEPLAGYYTTPEIEQAFRDILGKEDMADWYRAVVQANGLIKYGKTVLSPTTALRNWMSGYFFTVINGHFDVSHSKIGFQAWREYLHSRDQGRFYAYLRHLKELGVVYDTPFAGEMMRLLDDSNVEGKMSPETWSKVKNVTNFAQKFYGFGDDMWKIVGFENEKELLAKYKPHLSTAEIERQAAERIRNTYPTYSMTGTFVQKLRRFPLAGTFVSFPAEIIRTTANIIHYLREDMKDPALRPLAIRRAVGLGLASGLTFAAQGLSMALLGVDDEEEEAFRKMAAPWQKNSQLLPIGRNDDGSLRFIDMSFLDPYNYFKRPIVALMRDEPIESSLASAARDAFTPFFGMDIAAGAIVEILNNKKATGGAVFNPQDSVVEQTADITNHIRRAIQPGIASNLERAIKAARGEVSPSGQQYSLADEVLANLGFRVSTFNPRTALYYKAFEFNDDKGNANQILLKTLKNPNRVSDGDVESAFERAMKARRRAYERMGDIAHGALASGMSRDEVMRTLRKSGISRQDARALIAGQVPKWKPGADFMSGALRKSDAIYSPATRREFMQRKRQVMQLAQAGG